MMWSNRNSHSLLVEWKMVQPLWMIVWQFPLELNILLSYNPAIVHLGIYPKELKTYFQTKICAWMFIAALFITAKTWKQPRCPSVGEWINKMQYIQTMEYHSTFIRNELSIHEKTQRKAECISKWKKPIWKGYMTIYYMTPTIRHSG